MDSRWSPPNPPGLPGVHLEYVEQGKVLGWSQNLNPFRWQAYQQPDVNMVKNKSSHSVAGPSTACHSTCKSLSGFNVKLWSIFHQQSTLQMCLWWCPLYSHLELPPQIKLKCRSGFKAQPQLEEKISLEEALKMPQAASFKFQYEICPE